MAAEQIRPAVSYRQETLFLICPAGRIGKGRLSIAIGERIVPPLQGSGVEVGAVDPGLQPGFCYFAPLGLTCSPPGERENRLRAEALKTLFSFSAGEKVDRDGRSHQPSRAG
jgi:hypothetical protein